MKHTPGPWYVHKFNDGSICVRYGEGYDKINITGVIRPENYQDDKEMTANACLCAAGPDLLEACKDSYKLIALARPDTCGYVLVKLSDAIAKAEGGE